MGLTGYPLRARPARSGSWVLLVGIVAVLAPSGATHAQRLRPGNMPMGTQMRLLDDPYTISGETAEQILYELRTRGPRSWAAFSYVYSWRYLNERVPLATGIPSNNCAPTDFEMTFEVTATYPRWSAPSDAAAQVMDAWEAFSSQLDVVWDQARESMTRRADAARRRVEAYEDVCAFVDERVREIVLEIFAGPPPGMEDEPRQGLRWPPEGYEALLRPTLAEAPDDVAGHVEPAPRPLPVNEPRPVDESDEPEPPVASTRPVDPRPSPASPADRLVTVAPTLDEAVAADLDDGATGVVLRLDHEGALQFREAFGRSRTDDPEALDPDAELVFPSLTEILLATLGEALAEEGSVELDAPISAYLDGLGPRLGRTTLELLLSHRAGLDNAVVPDSMAWDDAMGRLDDRALFTEPGALYSYSRYSYPLAARVLEAATGTPIQLAISERILEPLEMDRTRVGRPDAPEAFDGLPATHTTADDLATFWAGWLDGRLPGTGPAEAAAAATALGGFNGRAFLLGTWHDWVQGRQRVSLMCGAPGRGDSAGIQVFPATRTILVFWSRYDLRSPEGAAAAPSADRWPGAAVRFTLSRIGDALRVGEDIYRPTRYGGGSSAAWSAVRCAEASASERRVTDFGPRVPTGEWAGRYANGEWLFDLVDVDGFLGTPADPSAEPFAVRHFGDDLYFAEIPVGASLPIGFPLRLRYDPAGRRYVVLGDRAYLHEDDRPPG